jgi:hypothetical protein
MPKNSVAARRAKSRNEPHKSNPPTTGGHEQPTNGTPPAALKMREARAYLGGLSVPTMHRLVKRGLLRPNRSTRYLIFARAELDRWIRDGMT